MPPTRVRRRGRDLAQRAARVPRDPERERRSRAPRGRQTGGRVGVRLHPPRGRHGRADAVGREGARPRRVPRVGRSGERADRARLRPLRRPAAGAARPLGVGSVRADDQGRLGVRPRRDGRQGAGLHPAQGRAAPRRAECAAGEPPFRVRRRRGDRRHDDRRLDREGRRRRGRGDHLRRRHAARRRARSSILRRAGSSRSTSRCRRASATCTPACTAAPRSTRSTC